MKYADLHVHPSGKNFPKNYNGILEDFRKPSAHLWDIPKSNLVNLVKGLRATSYSQADVGSLIRHGGKLIFASIYPLEEGFVKNLGTKQDPPLLLLKTALNYSIERIRFLRSGKVNYFQELQAEWEFLQRKSGQYSSGTIAKNPSASVPIMSATEKVSGLYYILSQHPDAIEQFREPWGSRALIGPDKLDQALDTDNCTVFVLTIEGMHALSMVNGDTPVPIEQLRNRIRVIKEWPVFFVTFAHHFRNDLCAHAKSFFRVPLPWNPDQQHHLNFIPYRENDRPFKNTSRENAEKYSLDERQRGFTEKGFEALCHLLSVRCDNDKVSDDPALGRRILIDTKHMSASARLEMYEAIIRPYWSNPGVQPAEAGRAPKGCIPVIASHSAYSGVATLLDMIEGYFEENDFPKAGNPFNYWNINLSDEDIEVIVRSGGLIGLNLDQRVLGVMFKMQLQHLVLPGLFKHPNERNNNIDLVLANILGMAKAVRQRLPGLHRFQPGTYSFWSCLCLGTDFDGGIDPVDAYSSSARIQQLRTDLHHAMLEAFRDGRLTDFVEDAAHLDILLDGFFYQNALQFLKQHF
jgi:hypothetical protein